MGWDQLAAELWTKIAGDCDKDGVRALCSPEMPQHIRDSARPVQFRDLKFRAYNIWDDLDLSNVDSNQYPSSLIEMQERSRQRFTELPLSPMVRHVRHWQYIGHLPPEQPMNPDVDSEPESVQENMKKTFLRTYADAMWPLFRASLPRYVGLTELELTNVVINDATVTSVNTLGNLRTLKIINCIVPRLTVFLRPFDHLTEYIQQEEHTTFRVELMMAVCSTLTSLTIGAGKYHWRELYSALEQCQVLQELVIEFFEVEEVAFERPPPEAHLAITACPRLNDYTGPAYYAADIITGRPVHTIRLIQLPDGAEEDPECIEWIREHFTKGTVPVLVFDGSRWPAYACAEEAFPTIFHEFPDLSSLRIVIEAFVLTDEVNLRDEDERERYKRWHYLNILHILSGPLPYEIPPTLETLELVTDVNYNEHPTHNFDEVVAALRNSANFANLQTLVVGTNDCFQTWTRLEPGVWNVVQEGDGFDFDGEGREYYSDSEDTSDDQGNITEEEEASIDT
ncbi:hypothetical protein JR316_0008374 [Psilocybe cubensis]|uniref:Uncharacterized protein n=2 Tax=Psilocybe cubensis TaxID=181762 RepID=A0ACB8GXP2_PSICU|nr:hypothetical protein JR316_0008374 [Psilocybe cubensis]KAH9479779.1 hypothetical protein JR316_0008374 [Psilocybe cubensis]